MPEPPLLRCLKESVMSGSAFMGGFQYLIFAACVYHRILMTGDYRGKLAGADLEDVQSDRHNHRSLVICAYRLVDPFEDLRRLFDVEQITESGEIKNFSHRRVEIANDHITLAIHSLCRAEQNTKPRAGDVVQLREIQNQLRRVRSRIVDLALKVGRRDRVKSALEKEGVCCSLFFNLDIQAGFAAQICGRLFVFFIE